MIVDTAGLVKVPTEEGLAIVLRDIREVDITHVVLFSPDPDVSHVSGSFDQLAME